MRNVVHLQQDMPAGMKPVTDMAFQPSKDTKQVPLDPAEPGKGVTIGVGLDSK